MRIRFTTPFAVSAAPSRARGRWWRASAHRARRFGYSNDTAGRRTAISRSGEAFGDLSGSTDSYGYNLRSEVVSARRTKGGASVRGFDEDFSYDPIGNRVSTTNYTETGSAIVSEYTANSLNQYTSRTVPGVAAVRGFADANATVTVNENPTWRLGEYFFGSDEFDNSQSSVDAALVTAAALASPANGPDEVASVTSRVHVAKTPQLFEYDDDGNQTLVTTKTGTWRVTYNGENRPVRWTRINAADTNAQTMISMNFDHQGRRRLYLEVAGDGSTNRLDHFTYDNYLCVARNRWSPAVTSATDRFVWDPTEPVATRPLVWNYSTLQPFNVSTCYYAHDGNKNVSELVSSADGSISAHYEYAPFGEVILSSGDLAFTNPFRFSSEYADDLLALVYYSYRHYEPVMGRWLCRDVLDECVGVFPYLFCGNEACAVDILGLIRVPLFPMTPFSPIYEIPPSPSVIDHLPWMDPSGEEEWFESRYRGVLAAARRSLTEAIRARINCKDESLGSGGVPPFEVDGGLQPIFPPWASDPNSGDNIIQYGDAGQTSWERWAALGRFTINLENFNVVYDSCINGRRMYHWSAIMYVSDGLGFSRDDGWPYWVFGTWLLPPRAARRAQWGISGEGECSCCEEKGGE